MSAMHQSMATASSGVAMMRFRAATVSDPAKALDLVLRQNAFGVIDIVRTQLWGERGSAKCVQMRARGGYWL